MKKRILFLACIATLCYSNLTACTNAQELSFIQQLKTQEVLNTKQQKPYENSIFDLNAYKELELEALVYHLDRTQTSYGLWGLFSLLQPSTTIEHITTRQKCIKQITLNDELYEQLGTLLNQIQQREHCLMRYWDKNDTLHKSADGLFFGLFGSYLNSSSLLLELANVRELATKTASLASIFFLDIVFMELYDASTSGRKPNIKKAFLEKLKKPFLHYSLAYNRYTSDNITQQTNNSSMFIENRPASLADKARWTSEWSGAPSWFSYPLEAFLAASSDAMLAYSCMKEITEFKGLFAVQAQLQNELTSTRQVFSLVKKVTSLAQLYPELQEQEFYSTFVTFTNAKSKKLSSKLQEALSLLGTSTFKNKAQLLFRRGRMLRTYKLLKETKEEWLTLLRAIGQLDAYVSIARLYREQAQQNNTYCFAEYNNNPQPLVYAQRVWNPFIAPEDAQANDISLGNNQASMAFITGPNALGKTTTMKSLAYAILFAQSWTIVPAHSCELTPFTGLRTYLNISDDLQQKLSSFTAEQARAQSIMSYAEENKNKKIFFLIDEPYRGTYPKEAENRAYTLCQELSQHNHCITTVATHLQKPTKLAEKYPKICANFHLYVEEVESNGTSTFVPYYTIKPGICSWWFTDEAKRARFIDWLFAQ